MTAAPHSLRVEHLDDPLGIRTTAPRLSWRLPDGARELALEWDAEYVSIPGRDHVSTLTSRAFKDMAIEFLAEEAPAAEE